MAGDVKRVPLVHVLAQTSSAHAAAIEVVGKGALDNLGTQLEGLVGQARAGLRQSVMIRHTIPALQPQKLPQLKGTRAAPFQPVLRVDAFDVAHKVYPKIAPRRYRRCSQPGSVTGLAGSLGKAVKAALDQDRLQTVVKHMTRPSAPSPPSPDMLIASAMMDKISGIDLKSMTATCLIHFVVLTSFDASHPELRYLPDDVVLVHHDRDITAELDEAVNCLAPATF